MKSQKQRVLAMLEAAGSRGVTTSEFAASYLPRFGARIMELRKAGFNIRTVADDSSRGMTRRYVLEPGKLPVEPEPERLLSDRRALNGIANALRLSAEWGPDELELVAQLVAKTGRDPHGKSEEVESDVAA